MTAMSVYQVEKRRGTLNGSGMTVLECLFTGGCTLFLPGMNGSKTMNARRKNSMTGISGILTLICLTRGNGRGRQRPPG